MNEEALRSTKKSHRISNKSRDLNEAQIADIALLLEKEAQILQFYSLGAVKFQDKKLGEILSLRAGLLERMLDFANSCRLGAMPPENGSEALAAKGMNEFLASALLIEKSSMMFYVDLINSCKNAEFKELLYKAQAVSYNEILPILKELNSKCEVDSNSLNLTDLLNEILKNPQELERIFQKYDLQNILNSAFYNLIKGILHKN
ncbi:hypothetical protein [Campylobacter gracilis]|uniref:Uncharacterized protein n=1 Tax=Campylobacter gracilis RM3268 TaxID=553220 RepID=C8PIS0_9BACT|nr:hypothetical protein [Campylobacter gracilis]AKT92461.1 hypothetical protein CGRAC_1011 [Campylobacter gracilis]EEV16825.1 hypothetical protein CAMGR0001_1119 [Campylobacter gracilis RM3268]UEB45359.1 hypothetical protein LK410_10290 [Campylobacter gracilis]SUW81976.1 Uncharacterised protein [Campylobacter gracilis]